MKGRGTQTSVLLLFLRIAFSCTHDGWQGWASAPTVSVKSFQLEQHCVGPKRREVSEFVYCQALLLGARVYFSLYLNTR